MYLFFDTETTGIPRNWNAPVTDLSNWPRMVQLAYVVYDNQGGETKCGNFIIRPEGYTIPSGVVSIHGITTERALREGHDLTAVLTQFTQDIAEVDCVVAHNMAFDEKIVGAEYLRCGMKNILDGKQKICTMRSTVNFCQIPSSRGYKWPKLQELHRKLFGKEFEDAHNALVDVRAMARCFWALREKGIF